VLFAPVHVTIPKFTSPVMLLMFLSSPEGFQIAALFGVFVAALFPQGDTTLTSPSRRGLLPAFFERWPFLFPENLLYNALSYNTSLPSGLCGVLMFSPGPLSFPIVGVRSTAVYARFLYQVC